MGAVGAAALAPFAFVSPSRDVLTARHIEKAREHLRSGRHGFDTIDDTTREVWSRHLWGEAQRASWFDSHSVRADNWICIMGEKQARDLMK